MRDGWSFRKIAREIGCAVNTVRNEYSRGKVLLYNGKIERYRAEEGQDKYEANRENCGRKFLTLTRQKFLRYVAENFRKNHWSIDACVGRALNLGFFKRDEIVCTKTLYNFARSAQHKKYRFAFESAQKKFFIENTYTQEKTRTQHR